MFACEHVAAPTLSKARRREAMDTPCAARHRSLSSFLSAGVVVLQLQHRCGQANAETKAAIRLLWTTWRIERVTEVVEVEAKLREGQRHVARKNCNDAACAVTGLTEANDRSITSCTLPFFSSLLLCKSTGRKKKETISTKPEKKKTLFKGA